ncbi:hypothetical protein, partial [Rhodovulum sulfidophilum]|uniref:hypothetical protein n=1 Tax=Rhodovulum sulfidophilum TaxID=35806 RepID=UPI001C4AFFF0
PPSIAWFRVSILSLHPFVMTRSTIFYERVRSFIKHVLSRPRFVLQWFRFDHRAHRLMRWIVQSDAI